jgi:hypothetical protein
MLAADGRRPTERDRTMLDSEDPVKPQQRESYLAGCVLILEQPRRALRKLHADSQTA